MLGAMKGMVNNMEQHDFLQGSEAWHQHRATHFNASDAGAMLGISPYKTRTQLLDEMATGIVPNVDEETQERFDAGHRTEALARPIAEKIIGRSLYPVIGSEGRLSASFDGLTSDDAICFEHKLLKGSLRTIETAEDIPEQHRAQMEQQLMISGAKTCLFMASNFDADDNLLEEIHVYYDSDQSMRDRLLQGWTQFSIDLETHQPKVISEKPTAQISIELPALFVNAHGAIIDSNIEAFGLDLTAKLTEVRAIKLVSDQDFSNAKAAAAMFREQYKKLELAKEAMLAQTVTIGEAARMIDTWREDLRVTALQLEKDVEREDLAKKRAMVTEGAQVFSDYIAHLEEGTKPIRLNIEKPDFASAIKGKRNYTSMQDAIHTLLANEKIKADCISNDIKQKLVWCKEHAAGMSMLFPDLQQLISKPKEDFELTITSRIDHHKAAEAAKLEAERQRIQAVATAKAESEAAAKLTEETVRIRAEEEARARAKVEEEQRATQDQRGKTEEATHAQPQATAAPQAPAASTPPFTIADLIDQFLATRTESAKAKATMRATLLEFVKFVNVQKVSN